MIKIKAILIVILSIFIVSCSFRKGPEPEITPVLDEQLSYGDSIESNPDQLKTSEAQVQVLTDKHINQVDSIFEIKEKDILTV